MPYKVTAEINGRRATGGNKWATGGGQKKRTAGGIDISLLDLFLGLSKTHPTRFVSFHLGKIT